MYAYRPAQPTPNVHKLPASADKHRRRLHKQMTEPTPILILKMRRLDQTEEIRMPNAFAKFGSRHSPQRVVGEPVGQYSGPLDLLSAVVACLMGVAVWG
jgi:hypothetical protein